jgi:hypothetical protein
MTTHNIQPVDSPAIAQIAPAAKLLFVLLARAHAIIA